MYQSSTRSVLLPNLSELLTSQQRLGSAGVRACTRKFKRWCASQSLVKFPWNILTYFEMDVGQNGRPRGPQMLVQFSINHPIIEVPNFDPYPNSRCQSCLYETYWLYWLDSGSKSGMPLKYPIASIFHWKRLYHLWFAHLLTKGIDVLIFQIWRYTLNQIESLELKHFEIFSGFLRLPYGFSIFFIGLSHIFPDFSRGQTMAGVRTWKAKPSHGFLHLDQWRTAHTGTKTVDMWRFL